MENPEKGSFSLVKKISLYVIFSLVLLSLFVVASAFVENQKYFSLSRNFSISYLLILVTSLLTISLISQTLENKWEIFVSPIMILVTSFFFLSQYKITTALLGSMLCSIYFILQFKRTLSLKDSLLRINIKQSGRPVGKGLLLTISAVISLAVFLNSKNLNSLDLGKIAADIAGKSIEEAIKKEYEKETPGDVQSIDIKSLQESNPQIFSILNSFGINNLPVDIPTSNSVSKDIAGTIKKGISQKVNEAVEPYRNFFGPTLALLVFGTLQIYGSVAYLIFSIISGPFLLLLKKLKFINIQKVQTEKEVIKI